MTRETFNLPEFDQALAAKDAEIDRLVQKLSEVVRDRNCWAVATGVLAAAFLLAAWVARWLQVSR